MKINDLAAIALANLPSDVAAANIHTDVMLGTMYLEVYVSDGSGTLWSAAGDYAGCLTAGGVKVEVERLAQEAREAIK